MDEFQRTATRAEVDKRRKRKAQERATKKAVKKASTGAAQRQLASTAGSRALGVAGLPASILGFLGLKGVESVKDARAARKRFDEASNRMAKAAKDKDIKVPGNQSPTDVMRKIGKGREVLQSAKAALKKHKVKSGDTISEIAKANNTTVAMIKRLNPDIRNVDKIRIGQTIVVDEGTARTPYKGMTAKEMKTGNVQRRPKSRPLKKGGSIYRRAGGKTVRNKGRGMGVALRGGGAVSKK
jgi:LysM repeat protein